MAVGWVFQLLTIRPIIAFEFESELLFIVFILSMRCSGARGVTKMCPSGDIYGSMNFKIGCEPWLSTRAWILPYLSVRRFKHAQRISSGVMISRAVSRFGVSVPDWADLSHVTAITRWSRLRR